MIKYRKSIASVVFLFLLLPMITFVTSYISYDNSFVVALGFAGLLGLLVGTGFAVRTIGLDLAARSKSTTSTTSSTNK